MKAILFAAGLGTRLGAMTQNTPHIGKIMESPCFPCHRKTEKFRSEQLVVNVHHFADQIISYLRKNDFGITVHISDEREQLLDTGGGMLKARPILMETNLSLHTMSMCLLLLT
jgi:NDP-sugar pyrophosphorylase family protein